MLLLPFLNVKDVLLPKPYIAKGTKLFKEKQLIELACVDKTADIYFTTDGSDPVISGERYTKPIEISDNKTLKFEARHTDKIPIEHTKMAEATFKKVNRQTTIILKNLPSPQYSGGATDVLVDGERGNDNWQLGGWQGFEGVDLEAVIDLKKETPFGHLILNCMEDQNAWIFIPTEIFFYGSNDGTNYTFLSSQKPVGNSLCF